MATPEETPETVIQARDLTRRFGTLVAVDGLDLDVHRGEVFGFLGPNGAGKSTTIRMLVGLLAPSSGSVRVLGLDMPGGAERLRNQVGYMTQKFSLYDELTVEENLDFAAEIFGLGRSRRRARVGAMLAEHELEPRRRQRSGTLSGGWKQRLALAVATIHEPELLLLDEPTAGVDPDNRRRFWERLFDLAAEGTTILVSTHYMDEAVRCHRLGMVRQGRLAAVGTPTSLTAALEGRVVEIAAEPTEDAVRALSQRPEVASATQLGDRVHALLAADGPTAAAMVPRLREDLAQAGFRDLVVEVARPNLEDVFVALLQGERLS
jgi:ABC-2 type transport system ATP-binding protein